MRKHFHQLALILVLGSGFALAQTMPSQQPSGSQGSSVPQTQSPSSTDQQPSAQPPSSTAPDKTLPNTDQSTQNPQSSPSSTSSQSDKPSTTDKSGQSLPQSDASATGNGDIQNTIQSAIQKDPSLANANVTVDVKNGKSVTLTGTVPNAAAKDAAERIAKDNSNGMKVKNHLKVASNSTDTTTNPKGDSSNPK